MFPQIGRCPWKRYSWVIPSASVRESGAVYDCIASEKLVGNGENDPNQLVILQEFVNTLSSCQYCFWRTKRCGIL